MKNDENTLNIFLQIKLKIINKKIKNKKKKFYNSLKFSDKTIVLNKYKKLIKKINCLINKLKFPKMKTNFNLSIIMNDDNDNTYFKLSRFVSSSISSRGSNYNMSELDISNSFYNYINKLRTIDSGLSSLIETINTYKNTKWYGISFNTGKAYGYNSGSTTVYYYFEGMEFNLTADTGECPTIYTDINGWYSGMSFVKGFTGNIIFTNIPTGWYFGIACLAAGGHTGGIEVLESGKGKEWYNYYCNGGGGGSMYYSIDLSKDDLVPVIGISYNISVDDACIFGNICANQGQDGSTTNRDSGGLSGEAYVTDINGINTTTSYCFKGGNGGGGASTTSGTISEHSNPSIPYLNNTTVPYGGGGGGGEYLPKVTVDTSPISHDTLQYEHIYYGNGGNGYGGVTYEKSSNELSNPDGYTSFDGGNYGGGGGSKINRNDQGFYSYDGGIPGDSICYFWWLPPHGR